MGQKSKTIIKETEEVSERDNPAVLSYRVGQLEIAMKDAALAQRESTESHKETAKELSTKIDTFAMNLASVADLEAVKHEGQREHERLDKRIDSHDQRIESVEKTVQNTPLANKLIFGLVGMILVSVIGAVISLVIKGQSN